MNIKHVAKTHTGKKCVVVFRELPDEPDNCLIVDTEALPDWMHDNIMQAVESPGAQASTDFYAYAERTVLTDGTNMLQTLHSTGRLQKMPTDKITMTPNNDVSVGLTEINNIVREQNGDVPTAVTPPTDQVNMAGKTMDVMESTAAPATSTEGINDTDLAKQFLAQAKGYETEAKSLKAQAYELAPGLKPGPKKPVAKKESETVSD
tara:strand:- start:614 stop:1231 length:618 start_codon:yes stop_codon:yes gene_type:complete